MNSAETASKWLLKEEEPCVNKMRMLVFLLFLLGADTIFGCMCGNISISEMYENSDSVVIAKVIGIKPAVVYEDLIIFENGDENKPKLVQEKYDGQEIQLEIIRWFKGANRKQTLKLSQPDTTCDWSFGKKDLNSQLLLYLGFNKKYKTYRIKSCGRSARLKAADDDLLWLKRLPKSLNRTRISGVVRFNDDTNLFPRVSNVKIKITGSGKEYNLVSNKNGLYEIWDLPAGKYTINAEMPEGKKLDWTNSTPDNWTYFWSLEDKPDLAALDVTLNLKSTAGIDFMLESK